MLVKKLTTTETAKLNAQHDALDVFLGKRTVRGMSFGGTDQSGDKPKANGEPWLSTHAGTSHNGAFSLGQDECANIAGSRFDTLSILGVDPETGAYFARSFENRGFYPLYQIERVGNVWTLAGDTERARVGFEDNGRTQNIAWEWRRSDGWLPPCDHIPARVD